MNLVVYEKSVVSYRFNFYVVNAFLSNVFISNTRLKLATNQAYDKLYPEVELLLLFTFFIYLIIQK